jgi:hemoglobin
MLFKMVKLIMKDIESRRDLENLLEIFYQRALKDEVIGYLFTEIAQIDLSHHLPVIVDFWEMVLFQTVNFQEKYGRSPMQVHLRLSEITELRKEHFSRWLTLFSQTVDEYFAGEKAELAKSRAVSIANTMLIKFGSQNPAGVQILR